MDIIQSCEQSALAVLCKKRDGKLIKEIAKFKLRLGNHYDLEFFGSLKFNVITTEKYGLVLRKPDLVGFKIPTEAPPDDCHFIVLVRAIGHDDIDPLKKANKANKDFDVNRLDKYGAFVLLQVRNPVSMFKNMTIEFETVDRAFFLRKFK